MAPESSNLKKGTRVVLVDDLPGVKAGTAGRVGRSIGIKSTRYRVHFENGVESLSVAEGRLVSPAAWAHIKDNQAKLGNGQTDPVGASARPVLEASTVGVAERSTSVQKTAEAVQPENPVSAAPSEEPAISPPKVESESSAVDDRLAALTAKSRDARKAAGVDVDAEVSAPEPAEAEDAPEPAEAEDASEPEAATVAEPDPEPAEQDRAPLLDLSKGYYPPDNRIADLLSSTRND